MLWKKRKVNPKPIKSNFLSLRLRPLLENRRVRFIVGGNLALSTILVGLLGPVGGPGEFNGVETAVLTPGTIQVITETTFRPPLTVNRGYSQGFYRFHPGVDIRAPRGTTVFAAANGVVFQIELGRLGYGHKIVINHDNKLTTLYAHLDDVYVKVGDRVTKETPIGKVGLTGWTTGPHLHFEVTSAEGRINPKQVLPEI